MKGRPFHERLRFAGRGLVLAFRHERSFRIHLIAAALVLMTLLIVQPAVIWWGLLGLAVGLVMVAELLNSALEALADHLHPDQHPQIGVAKDLAAAAVLIASMVAVAVGAAFLFSLVRRVA